MPRAGQARQVRCPYRTSTHLGCDPPEGPGVSPSPGRRTKESRVSSSDIFIGETIGTAVLVLLGGGVCAAVTLRRSKAHNAELAGHHLRVGLRRADRRLHSLRRVRRPSQSGGHDRPGDPGRHRVERRAAVPRLRTVRRDHRRGARLGRLLRTVPRAPHRPRGREGPAGRGGHGQPDRRSEGGPRPRRLQHGPGDPQRRAERRHGDHRHVRARPGDPHAGPQRRRQRPRCPRCPDHRAGGRRDRSVARRPDRLRDQPGA